jgi:signal transduction histidine kinase
MRNVLLLYGRKHHKLTHSIQKINHFEKNWRRSRRGGTSPSKHGPRDQTLRQTDLPMINLFANIDVSIVCEEVVEGVFAGHVFQNVTAPSFDLVAEPRGKMSDTRKIQYSSDSEAANDPSRHQDVAVIIDIDYDSYQFTTQPGAFRRVIMNLLGNALKYTSKGYVRVKLEVSKIEDLHPGTKEAVQRSCIKLTVLDTGKGISAEFLRSKLFTAFAQENSLSSGTGLGLSIVRSIVSLLEGEIQVKSNVGQGTGKYSSH